MDDQLSCLYDREADVLYVSKGHPEFTDYQELDNLILRLDPRTKEIVGFTIVDFEGRFAETQSAVTLPLKATFSRAKLRKQGHVAETRSSYRAKRPVRKRVSALSKKH